jgi:hypothetical protein
MAKPRLIIADDRTLLVEAVQELRPDVVILDVTTPFLNELDAGRQFTQLSPTVKLGFVTMNDRSGPGRRDIPGRWLGVPPEPVGRLGIARGHPGGDTALLLCDAVGDGGHAGVADARGETTNASVAAST